MSKSKSYLITKKKNLPKEKIFKHDLLNFTLNGCISLSIFELDDTRSVNDLKLE